jgi:hypothetical protein
METLEEDSDAEDEEGLRPRFLEGMDVLLLLDSEIDRDIAVADEAAGDCCL